MFGWIDNRFRKALEDPAARAKLIDRTGVARNMGAVAFVFYAFIVLIGVMRGVNYNEFAFSLLLLLIILGFANSDYRLLQMYDHLSKTIDSREKLQQ